MPLETIRFLLKLGYTERKKSQTLTMKVEFFIPFLVSLAITTVPWGEKGNLWQAYWMILLHRLACSIRSNAMQQHAS